jgi:hypothetical protein
MVQGKKPKEKGCLTPQLNRNTEAFNGAPVLFSGATTERNRL